MPLRQFTLDELAQYNGENGAAAYISFLGRVYDVSASFQWQNGKHQVVHKAGKDLSSELAEAPHGADLLARVRLIGELGTEG